MEDVSSYDDLTPPERPKPCVPKRYQHKQDKTLMLLQHPAHIPLASRFNPRAIILPSAADIPVIAAAHEMERRVRHREGSIWDFDYRVAEDLRPAFEKARVPMALTEYVIARERAIYGQLAPHTTDRRLRFIATGANATFHRDTLNNVYIETLIGKMGTQLAHADVERSLDTLALESKHVDEDIAPTSIDLAAGQGVLFNLNWQEGTEQNYNITGVVHASPITSKKKGGVPRFAIGYGMGGR